MVNEMGVEIERKLLVDTSLWSPNNQGTEYIQGYILNEPGKCVRIRIAGEYGFLTIKAGTNSLKREEYEYGIPINDARNMIKLCENNLISKIRHVEEYDGNKWEIDVFKGDNEGLVMAEIELNEENQQFSKPSWLLEEVTDNPRYINSNLIYYPFNQWPDEFRLIHDI